MAFNNANRFLLDATHDRLDLLGVELLVHGGVTCQIGKENGCPATFALIVCRFSLEKVMAARRAELHVEEKTSPAIRTRFSEARPALQADISPDAIV